MKTQLKQNSELASARYNLKDWKAEVAALRKELAQARRWAKEKKKACRTALNLVLEKTDGSPWATPETRAHSLACQELRDAEQGVHGSEIRLGEALWGLRHAQERYTAIVEASQSKG